MKDDLRKSNVPPVVSAIRSEVFEGIVYKVKVIPPVHPGEWPAYVDIANAKKVLSAKVENES